MTSSVSDDRPVTSPVPGDRPVTSPVAGNRALTSSVSGKKRRCHETPFILRQINKSEFVRKVTEDRPLKILFINTMSARRRRNSSLSLVTITAHYATHISYYKASNTAIASASATADTSSQSKTQWTGARWLPHSNH